MYAYRVHVLLDYYTSVCRCTSYVYFTATFMGSCWSMQYNAYLHVWCTMSCKWCTKYVHVDLYVACNLVHVQPIVYDLLKRCVHIACRRCVARLMRPKSVSAKVTVQQRAGSSQRSYRSLTVTSRWRCRVTWRQSLSSVSGWCCIDGERFGIGNMLKKPNGTPCLIQISVVAHTQVKHTHIQTSFAQIRVERVTVRDAGGVRHSQCWERSARSTLHLRRPHPVRSQQEFNYCTLWHKQNKENCIYPSSCSMQALLNWTCLAIA